MSEILTGVIAFLLGYGVCWYLNEEKLLQAYEDGVIDGKGLADIRHELEPRQSWETE